MLSFLALALSSFDTSDEKMNLRRGMTVVSEALVSEGLPNRS